MANFGPKDIKKLRETTNAGMMDCKKALSSSDGNMDKAIAWLREKGLGAAAKKADKIATEGIISIKIDKNRASIIEINSQTDFVAQNDTFKKIVSEIADHTFKNNLNSVEDINNSSIDNLPFKDFLSLKIALIGENLVIRKAGAIYSDNNNFAINGYVHANNRVGVILGAECESEDISNKIRTELKNIAMHAAAMSPSELSYKNFSINFVKEEQNGRIEKIKKENEELSRLKKPLKNIPEYISKLQLTDEIIKKEELKLKDQLKKEGKPEKIWDKIIPGKLNRFISDNTSLDQELALLDQKYVMNDSITVEEHINEISNGKAKITHFLRFEVGAGIEIKEENFAEEVAKQMQ